MIDEEQRYHTIEGIVAERKRGRGRGRKTQFRVRWAEESVPSGVLDTFGGNLRAEYDSGDGEPVFATGYGPNVDLWTNRPCGATSNWKIVAVYGREMKHYQVYYRVRWEDNWVDEDKVNDQAKDAWRDQNEQN